jgi:hypothetical protein
MVPPSFVILSEVEEPLLSSEGKMTGRLRDAREGHAERDQ